MRANKKNNLNNKQQQGGPAYLITEELRKLYFSLQKHYGNGGSITETVSVIFLLFFVHFCNKTPLWAGVKQPKSQPLAGIMSYSRLTYRLVIALSKIT